MSPSSENPLNNLEQQHKRAKELLAAARTGDANALARIRVHRTDAAPTLADAQLAIAREAGFASWARLVEFVELEEKRTRLGPMFPRFAEGTRRVLFFSRYHAAQLGSPHIEPEHVLLALLQNNARPDAALDRVAALDRLSLETCQHDLQKAARGRPALTTEQQIPFSAATRSAFDDADREAVRGGNSTVRCGHLLLGLLHDRASALAPRLAASGITLEEVRREMNPPDAPRASR